MDEKTNERLMSFLDAFMDTTRVAFYLLGLIVFIKLLPLIELLKNSLL